MKKSLLACGLILFLLSGIWYLVCQSAPADLSARTATVVSVNGNSVELEIPDSRDQTLELPGGKVGDEVPVWITLSGGHFDSLRDGPVKPSNNWLYLLGLAIVCSALGLWIKAPANLDGSHGR